MLHFGTSEMGYLEVNTGVLILSNHQASTSIGGSFLAQSLSVSSHHHSLVAPPILTAWLLTNQHYIKLIQVTNFYSV